METFSHNQNAELLQIINTYVPVDKFSDPIVVAKFSNVKSKMILADIYEKHDGLGHDIVVSATNDLLTTGALPLAFFVHGKDQLSQKIREACEDIGCAYLDHADHHGMAIGIVDKSKILGAHNVRPGDTLIGLRSKGLHLGDFSVVEKILINDLRHKKNDVLWQTERGVMTVADEILMPAISYVNSVKTLLKRTIEIHAIAHIGHAGLMAHLLEIIPSSAMAEIDLSDVAEPLIFNYLREQGRFGRSDMLNQFNMGLGLVMAVKGEDKEKAIHALDVFGQNAIAIGDVKPSKDGSKINFV